MLESGFKCDPKSSGRIGVLMGGCSSEREISLKSGKAIFEALQRVGAPVVAIDITQEGPEQIESQLRNAAIETAFIALHGRLGEDGIIQGILDRLHIPYPGSGVAASRTAIHKSKTQTLLKRKGLPVAPHVTLSQRMKFSPLEIMAILQTWPVVVKPACEGSSIGVKICHNLVELENAIKDTQTFGPDIIIEGFIKGREFTVGILGGEALPVVEIRPRRTYFDFTAKYQKGETDYLVPAPLPPETAQTLQECALKTFEVLGCEDFSRIDIMLSEEGKPYILEINTIPGFTATSLLPKAAQAAGITFEQLCWFLIEKAYGKKKEHQGLTGCR